MLCYIKHVRHGYSKSFYSFLNRNYHPTAKDSRDAMKFDKFLRQKNLIIRTNRTYSWNTQQKTILVNEIVNFFNQLYETCSVELIQSDTGKSPSVQILMLFMLKT